jgi:hypothetical protein
MTPMSLFLNLAPSRTRLGNLITIGVHINWLLFCQEIIRKDLKGTGRGHQENTERMWAIIIYNFTTLFSSLNC